MKPLPNLRPLSLYEARSHGWLPARTFAFVQQMPVLSAQIGELGALVPSVPLAFAKLGVDRFGLVLVTGFADNHNQLVDAQGRWVLQVLPMELRVYPFALQAMTGQEDGAPSQFALCFNHASGLYREAPDEKGQEQRFFTEDGHPQALLQSLTDQLQGLVSQQRLTQRAVEALRQHDLLAPWQIQPREGRPDEVLPQGLYRIEESRLSALKGETLEALHQAHALALAYGQLLSMSRITVLQRLKDVHEARLQAQAAAATQGTQAVDPAIVQQAFDLVKGDTLKFNF
jgi:hypothetical protein